MFMPKYNPNSKETYDIVAKMVRYGGSFVKCLADLFLRADAINRQKIVTTWENYFNDYSEMGRLKGVTPNKIIIDDNENLL